MILQALVNYYEALAEKGEISRLGWCKANVIAALNISRAGELLNIVPLKQEVLRGKKTVKVPRAMEVPERVVRASGYKSNFLCDNGSYILGIDAKGKRERAFTCFETAKELHTTVLDKADGLAAEAVKNFFLNWNAARGEENEIVKEYFDDIVSGGNLIFQIEGEEFAHEDSSIIEAWEFYSTQSSGDENVMQCLVTGKQAPIAIVHAKIKGVQGAQSVGASLVGFNAPAYESYGKNGGQGLNAPIGAYAAFAYSTALNKLLRDEKHRQVIGDTTLVFWAENAEEIYQDWFVQTLNPSEDSEGTLKDIFGKMSKGNAIGDVQLDIPFYVLGLAPNAARISVRFFLRDSFGNMLENLRRHYERMEIEKAPYEKEYLSAYSVLRETVNLNSRDKTPSPLMAGAFLRSILTGTPYPRALYNSVLVRVRSDQDNDEKRIRKINRGRAAVIKAYLLQNFKTEKDREVLTVALNKDSQNQAYVLGRLFAVLEDIQSKANPEINSTIKDRYFDSACGTPAVVFPTLLKLSNHHISKLKEGKWKEKDIGEIMDKLEISEEPFPRHLSLEQQGIFILGYYHQRQNRFEKKEAEDK